MVDTHSGAPGLPVARHADQGAKNANVHAPVPDLKAAEETAVHWDELQKQRRVTRKDALVRTVT